VADKPSEQGVDGKLYCLFALSLGEHFCNAQLIGDAKMELPMCWTHIFRRTFL
jgi:hypothetical protein